MCVYFALHGPFHGVPLLFLQLPGDLLSLHDRRLDEEEHGGDVHHHHPHEGEPEAPGEIVVLAVRHEVSTAPVEFHLIFVALVVEAIGAGMPQSKVCEFRTWSHYGVKKLTESRAEGAIIKTVSTRKVKVTTPYTC